MEAMANILLIGDDPGILTYLTRLLSVLGHQVACAPDGPAGLRQATVATYDVFITDLNMPGDLSGANFIQRLRETFPDVPVVVVTGQASADSVEKCKSLGVSDFLAKPFELAMIKKVVDRLLAHRTHPAAG